MKKASAINRMTRSKQTVISRELNRYLFIALCLLLLGQATNIYGQVQTSLNDEQKIAGLALLWKEAVDD